jgi:hypothetical protein
MKEVGVVTKRAGSSAFANLRESLTNYVVLKSKR